MRDRVPTSRMHSLNLRAPLGRAAFVDRDGTIIQPAAPGKYTIDPEEVVLLEGAAEAIQVLNRAGILVIVATNQRCVALGQASLSEVGAVNERMLNLIHQRGGMVDAIYTCPHGIEECDCRKPRPGLLTAAARIHNVRMRSSVMIGDSETDVTAGAAAGLYTIRLSPENESTAADELASSLTDAVIRYLSWLERWSTPAR
jgi:D-glycero-D-manno-heptose 1,7-bisphosphate phosphatase